MHPIKVDIGNFVRAETNRMLAGLYAGAGGINRFFHAFAPTPLDAQNVIRMNRDTLYSAAVVDLAGGATLTVPEHGDRYTSVMIVNQDHYINRIIHEPGEHSLTVDEFDTEYVLVAARVLADPVRPDDVAEANTIQRAFAVEAASGRPFVLPDYDQESFDAVRDAVLALGRHMGGGGHSFGRRGDVDPIRHLCGTAVGWGGLPESEAVYEFIDGEEGDAFVITVGEVPVDAFWSLSMYGADGFFHANPYDRYSVNSLTAQRESDGTVLIHLGGDPAAPNFLPIGEGWNTTVRLYRPRPEILTGGWTFPRPVRQ